MVDKLLHEYITGAVNVYSGELVIGRERTSSGYEYVIVETKDGFKLYDFWHNPFKKTRPPGSVPPKHNGRKQPYVMLMLRGIRELQCKNRLEIMGAIMSLADNIEWNTGMLIQKRPKRFLKSSDFPKIFGYGKSKCFKLLKQMKELGIIEKTKDGYRISEKYIRRGAGKNAG